AQDGLWGFQDPELGKRLIAEYEEEKQVQVVPIYGSDGQLEGFKPAKPPAAKAPPKPTPPPPKPAPRPAPAAAPKAPPPDAVDETLDDDR
ncbi:MAG: hypothetical protein ACKN9W_19020, partial [Methylococcus sp.]